MSKKTEKHLNKIINMYVNLDCTTYEIADIFKCHRSSISRLLKRHGVSIKRYKRAYSFYYEQKLNETQIQLIEGSLLGDGHVAKHHDGPNSCRFVEQHGIKQLGYLEWKKELLNNFVSNDIAIKDNSKNKSYSNGLSCSFETVLHKDFVPFRERFYDTQGNKIVKYFKLSPLSLAVWYFDDGSISRINQKGAYYSIQMHTEDFDDNSIDIMRQMLLDQFGIDTGITTAKNKYKLITMGHRNANILMEIVSPYQISCMSYKIKFSDNPVETQNNNSGVSDLKCSDANTHNSLPHSEMMV